MKKQVASMLLIGLLSVSASLPMIAAADAKTDNGIKIVIDGSEGAFADAPIVKNNQVFLPLRAVAEELGAADIVWSTPEKSVTLQKGDTKIYVRIGSTEANIGEKAVQLSVAPFVSGSGKTYVPADFVGQALGKQVTWNTSVKSVSIETRNKDKAVEVLKSFETGDSAAALKWISADKYIQHNLAFPNGRETLVGAIGQLKGAGVTYDVTRAIEDGDYVAVHSLVNLFGSKSAVFDIFRFENGKIVEHWDNLQPLTEPNSSGHTMVDGTTEITDLDKTEENKAIVRKFAEEVFMGGNIAAMPTYIDGENYTQHNPMFGDGLSTVMKAFEGMAEQGVTVSFDKIHMVIGEGDFVLVVGEGTFNGNPNSIYDLFRVKNGKLVEHWDVIETIPPQDQWKNTNGKF
ncbi:stalk domain-containing protein [Paenibacillus harenae]|uniref:SnoaL-like aldol condensation-catalyzing enzyme n=1 Tax=Paenibacillus harenae TaxID=306543 RepID=A0ABT9U869_PAEHA|nr:stalk domain-containing protein [Paenibacillus harenae]MDQ0115849.1 putative SnoaL-like aldol condensation-catalyzing enzyme [Paenibacillus harenae]